MSLLPKLSSASNTLPYPLEREAWKPPALSFSASWRKRNAITIPEKEQLEDILHPGDYNWINSIIEWLKEAGTHYLARVTNDIYLTVGVRTRRSTIGWAEEYLVLEASQEDGVLSDIQARIIPGTENKEILNITPREREVLQLIAGGFSNKQIADKLCISIHTAINHRKHLIDKFQVKNTAEMICEAGRRHLV